jgi:hypothetical protein
VDPDEVFERALTDALGEPDRIARRRAAEQLGGLERPGAEALAALATSAAEDSDEEVRATALEALDRLDDAVSIPRRVIDAWAEAPAEAGPFISGVLSRLAGGTSRAGKRVTELSGQVTREGGALWLTLNRVPSLFEKKMPVVAIPVALRGDPPPIHWSGERPGLVRASAPVSEGVLRVRLGTPAARGGHEDVFERVYLLDAD